MQPASARDMQPAISLTLSEVLHEWANHDLDISANRGTLSRACVSSLSGPFMKYSNPQP